MPIPFLARLIRAILIALCNRSQARSTDFVSQLVFWSAHERPALGLPINLTLEALGIAGLIVIRDLMFGDRGHFRGVLTGSEEWIASNILADRLAHSERFELPTLGIEIRCSIQLSYECVGGDNTDRPDILPEVVDGVF